MSIYHNRAFKRRVDRLIQNDWKAAVDQDIYFFINLERNETELAKLLLIFDLDDLEVADLQRKLALQYVKLNDFPKSVNLMEKAVNAYRKHFAFDDPELLGWEAALALLYPTMDRHDEAIDLLENCLEITRNKTKVKHKVVRLLMKKLARVYLQAGQDLRAVVLLEELLERLQDEVHPDSPLLAPHQLSLAKAYRQAGMTATAIQLLRLSLEVNLAASDPYDKQMGDACWEILVNYSDLGCYREALHWLDDVLEIDLKHRGIMHIDIPCLLEYKADLYFKLGEWDRGRTMLREAFYFFRDICGEGDERTQRVKGKLEDYA